MEKIWRQKRFCQYLLKIGNFINKKRPQHFIATVFNVLTRLLEIKFGANGASSRRLGHAQASLGATLGLLHFFNACVVLLQALHFAVALLGSGDALNGVVGTGEGRDVRHLVVDASRPWLRFGHTKMQAFLCDTHLVYY